MDSRLEDYAIAASYFHQLAPFYAQNEWKELEVAILGMYARCLKKLDRTEEYIRITLKMLSRTVAVREAAWSSRKAMNLISTRVNDFQGRLTDVVKASSLLDQHIVVPMNDYFSTIHVDLHLQHDAGTDGFRLSLSFHCLLPDTIESQEIKVRLISSTEGSNRNIWLAAEHTVKLTPGFCRISLASKVRAHYRLGQALLTPGRL